MTSTVGRVGAGWGVVDVEGRRLGTIARIYRPDPMVDEEVMEVRTGLLGLGRRLRVPTTAIRAAAQGRVLLSEPRAGYIAGARGAPAAPALRVERPSGQRRQVAWA